MKVLLYGRLAEAMGRELELGAPPGSSVAEIRDRLIATYPAVEKPLQSPRARACVGDCVVGDDYRLRTGDTLEFLPPVSGG